MSEPSLLNVDVLDECFDINADDTRELIDMYLAQAEETIADLCRAIETGETEHVRELAHRLAGSSAVCGVAAMVDPLRALEQQGREGHLSDAEPLIATIHERLESCRRLLDEYFAKKRG